MAVSKKTRECNAKAIRETCRRWAPGSDPRGLLAFAWRESNWNHMAAGDQAAASRAFSKHKGQRWVQANPWVGDPSLWGASRGLFQMMPVFHLQRWDPSANPLALHHPVIATIAAGRLWNRAVQMGAKNLIDVRIVWGYGQLKHRKGSPQWDQRLISTRKRLILLGYPADLAEQPISAWKMSAFARGPQPGQADQMALIARSLGLPTSPPPAQAVPENYSCVGGGPSDSPGTVDPPGGSSAEPSTGVNPWLVGGAVAAGGLTLWAVGRSRRR